MGNRGPAKKPKKLDDLDGNPGNRPKQPDPVEATGEACAPDWLGDYAVEIWRSIIKSMPPNFYASVDTMALASYCQASSFIKRASEEIDEHGITLKNANGNTVRNPACSVLSDNISKIASLGTRLGLDPAARQSLGIYATGGAGGEDEAPETEFGDLIGINGGKKKA